MEGDMKQSGVTLLELMVTLAVMAILLAAGIPAYSSFVHKTRLTGAANGLLSSLYLARSEAIKRNSRTVLCPSLTGSACSNDGRWEHGWIVFHDVNNNGVLDSGEPLILQHQKIPGLAVTGNTPVQNYVSYSPTGAAKRTSGAFQAGTLTLCQEADPGNSRLVIISITGRPRVARAELSSC
jgi:type IV fimbrial biogenesis protein FimT